MNSESLPKITNIVVKFSLPFNINLKTLKGIYEKVDYRPVRFNGAIVKTKLNCMLIFSNGRVNVVGNKVEEDAYIVMRELVKRLGHEEVNPIGSIVNVVGTCSLGQRVDLNTIAADGQFEYNPELYPAAYYKSEKGKVSIFHTGKLVFTGFKNLEDMYEAYDEVDLEIKIRI